MHLRPLRTVAVAIAAVILAAAPAAAAGASPQGRTPQREIDAYLRDHPGGAQVSDNALAYRGGDVVVVFPNPGEQRAPVGLGSNIRSTQLASDVSSAVTATTSVAGCPNGTIDHWYCFYTDSNYGGRRLQFLNTCADWASNWGFNNMTSSWVNTNPYSQIVVWDYAGGQALWVEGYGISYNSWVGSSANDRMSYWTRTNC